MIYFFITLICLTNLNCYSEIDYDPNFDSNVKIAANNRYQDSWFFKNYRIKKYIEAAKNLSESSKKLLTAHTTSGRTISSSKPQDLTNLDQDIQNLSNQKKSLLSKNFSGKLLKDLQTIRDIVTKNRQKDISNILAKHQPIYDQINAPVNTIPNYPKVPSDISSDSSIGNFSNSNSSTFSNGTAETTSVQSESDFNTFDSTQNQYHTRNPYLPKKLSIQEREQIKQEKMQTIKTLKTEQKNTEKRLKILNNAIKNRQEKLQVWRPAQKTKEEALSHQLIMTRLKELDIKDQLEQIQSINKVSEYVQRNDLEKQQKELQKQAASLEEDLKFLQPSTDKFEQNQAEDAAAISLYEKEKEALQMHLLKIKQTLQDAVVE